MHWDSSSFIKEGVQEARGRMKGSKLWTGSPKGSQKKKNLMPQSAATNGKQGDENSLRGQRLDESGGKGVNSHDL